jgi:hypothetical protein
MSQQATTLCRRLETALQAAIKSTATLPAVYRGGEDIERTLPCCVIECRPTGEDLGLQLAGTYATAAALRLHAIVAASDTVPSAQAVETLLAALVTAVETASISGFTYVHLERSEEERTIEDSIRHHVATYSAVLI